MLESMLNNEKTINYAIMGLSVCFLNQDELYYSHNSTAFFTDRLAHRASLLQWHTVFQKIDENRNGLKVIKSKIHMSFFQFVLHEHESNCN